MPGEIEERKENFVLAWLKKMLAVKKSKPGQRRGQVVTGQERLIPFVDLSRSRRTRQGLLSLQGLDPQTRNALFNMQFMTDDEIHGPRRRWSDPH